MPHVHTYERKTKTNQKDTFDYNDLPIPAENEIEVAVTHQFYKRRVLDLDAYLKMKEELKESINENVHQMTDPSKDIFTKNKIRLALKKDIYDLYDLEVAYEKYGAK
jgi:S-adenosylmethionine synthetase